MHLIMLLGALSLAWVWRCRAIEFTGTWTERWQRSLILFLLPPLLLLSSAIAVVWMGPYGPTMWSWDGWLSYGIFIGFVGLAVAIGVKLGIEGSHTLRRIRTYPIAHINGKAIRMADLPALYSVQVGFWHPELVMSQSLLDTLTPEHLQAVFAHEQAHYHYRDTFWFFGLGWLRRITAWLPQTEALWQELLVLRELRADWWAAQQIDALLLAEALLLVVQDAPLVARDFQFCAAFSSATPPNRLHQRIEALLTQTDSLDSCSLGSWSWLLLVLLPFITIPLHNFL
jgi:Zn-dependent protease with chaperone function